MATQLDHAAFAKSAAGSSQSAPIVEIGFASERGERPDNQDFAGAIVGATADSLVIAAVADGVGGAAGGRVAAETAVRGFIEGCIGQIARKSPKEAALQSLEAINRWIHAMGRRNADLEGMACTFTAVLCRGRRAHLVHVGDSRLYRLRGDRLEVLTVDHVAGPDVTHMLARAVGGDADVVIDYRDLQIEPFDRYVLCTDGVHGAVNAAAFRDLLGRHNAPDTTARELVATAIAGRLGDNATALVLDILAVPGAGLADVETTLSDKPILPVPALGALIDGFRLEELLSDGRLIRVLKAIDTTDSRKVVLKFPKPLPGADRTAINAFVRETWISSKVESPFVGEVIQLAAGRQTQLYLVQPFYDGETLEQRLKRGPPLSLTAGLGIAQKLARGVAAVHRAGIIHRDIKPDNVIVQPFVPHQHSGLKLIDFGVARWLRSPALPDTQEPGTPSYMAPELFAGASADERSDQFSLGVTVYRLFANRYPYGEIEPFSHPKFGKPTPLHAHRPDLPAWLGHTVEQAIAVDPNERYQDVLEFMFELEHGAERASPITAQRQPLYQKNPLLFWKVVAAVLFLFLIFALLLLAQARSHVALR